MIIPDVNLLVYAYNSDAPAHTQARQWWESLLSSNESVAIPWAVLCGFVRIMTHPAVLVVPMTTTQALKHVRSWLSLPHVQVLDPGSRHLEILEESLRQAGTGGNFVTDAHIAAIALEYQAQVHSNDVDFTRFSGLRWHNPLQK